MKRRYDNVVTFDDTFSSEIIWYQRWWHWFIVAGRTWTTSCSLGRSQLVPAPPCLSQLTPTPSLTFLQVSTTHFLQRISQDLRQLGISLGTGDTDQLLMYCLIDLRTATNRQIASASKKPECQVILKLGTTGGPCDFRAIDWEGVKSLLVLREMGGEVSKSAEPLFHSQQCSETAFPTLPCISTGWLNTLRNNEAH